MASDKAERLLNLYIMLLAQTRFVPKQDIRRAHYAEYADDARGDEAFEKAFERDKDDLRELGVVRAGADDRREDRAAGAAEELGPAVQDRVHVAGVAAGVGVRDGVHRQRYEGVAQQRRPRRPAAAGPRLCRWPPAPSRGGAGAGRCP